MKERKFEALQIIYEEIENPSHPTDSLFYRMRRRMGEELTIGRQLTLENLLEQEGYIERPVVTGEGHREAGVVQLTEKGEEKLEIENSIRIFSILPGK